MVRGFWNGLLLVAWRKWGPGPGKTTWGKTWRIFATYNALCFGLVFLYATPQRWKSALKEAFATAPAWALGVTVVVGGILSLFAGFAGFAAPFFHFQI